MKNDITINDRIRQVMDTFELSEVKFAKKAGVSKGAVYNVIHNNEDPSYALLRNIATVFPVNQEWLILGKGKPFSVENVGKWKKASAKNDQHIDTEVNDRVKEIRLVKNLSQTLFAAEIGVTRDVISNIESNRTSPSIWIVKSVSREYSVNPMWIMYGDKPMFLKQGGN